LAAELTESQRRFVAERAAHRCEYCQLHEDDSYSPHQIDHIISRKHGGSSEVDNLAYACLRCNAWKGSDIGSLDPQTGAFVSFFHPRRHRWQDHFALRGAVIEPLTAEGEATVRVLKINLDKRVVERQILMAAGRYPG
jgi:HNH endonuclease